MERAASTGRRYRCGMRLAILGVVAAALAGCATTPPPRWAQGGAMLVLPSARWERPDGDVLEIRSDGQVLEGGSLLFVVDRVGRVVDEDYEPVALLFPDGRLAGSEDRALGHVGISNAAPPDRHQAWLSVAPDGGVVYYDEDGERASGGRWTGCEGAAHRTCTLVTHLLAVRNYARRPAPGVGIGVGVGVGFGF
jgi:hypothetical protein